MQTLTDSEIIAAFDQAWIVVDEMPVDASAEQFEAAFDAIDAAHDSCVNAFRAEALEALDARSASNIAQITFKARADFDYMRRVANMALENV